jgi:hypothetical protein
MDALLETNFGGDNAPYFKFADLLLLMGRVGSAL